MSGDRSAVCHFPRAGGGRPALPDSQRRLRGVSIYVTDAEYDVIRSSAALARVSMSDYCRAAATGVPLPTRFNRRALHALARIGNNLNQLTRHANTTGRIALEAELYALADAVRATIRTLR